MRAKIFSFVKCSEQSMIASVRIARFVSAELQMPITVNGDVADDPLDVLVIVNGAYAFCNYLEELGAAVETAKRVVWIQNDFTIIPPRLEGDAQSPFRRAFVSRHLAGKQDPVYWSTCEDWATRPGSSYVNWNCLTLEPRAPSLPTREAVVYYGSYRANRKRYFDRYFAEPRCQTIVSSPSKKFREEYRHSLITHEDAVRENLGAWLAQHALGLYLEDRQSHSSFHSPANRFYEMLGTGLPIVFQPECGAMMRKAGYDPTPWVAQKPLDVSRMIEKSEHVGLGQRAAWLDRATAERAALPTRLKQLWREVTS